MRMGRDTRVTIEVFFFWVLPVVVVPIVLLALLVS